MHTNVFPGQASQKRSMRRRGLFDDVPKYATVEKEVDLLLGCLTRRLCPEESGTRLNQTQYSQPSNALYLCRAKRQGVYPDYIARHSLGEHNAVLAAVFGDDALDFSDAMTVHDVAGWDSLTHITLVVAVEMEFGLRLSVAEICKLAGVAEFVAMVEARLPL